MNTKIVVLTLLVIAVLIVMTPPSKIQGTENYTDPVTPDPGYGSCVTVVTPDELDRVIRATQRALSKQIGKCTYCIETTNICRTGNTYTGSFLFVAMPSETGGSTYGIGVESTVDTKGNVSNITLQSNNTIDQMDPYEQFKTGSDIQASTLPTVAQLQSALNNV